LLIPDGKARPEWGAFHPYPPEAHRLDGGHSGVDHRVSRCYTALGATGV
jgi:hypothetical protein